MNKTKHTKHKETVKAIKLINKTIGVFSFLLREADLTEIERMRCVLAGTDLIKAISILEKTKK